MEDDNTEGDLDLFSVWLKGYFQTAWNLPYFHANVCGAIVGDSVPGDSMPDATVYKMMAVVDVQYRAVLQTLIYPESALAAQSLIRGLTEAWAHVDYIWSDGSQGAPCRALALELGFLTDRKAMLASLPDDPDLRPRLALVNANIRAVEDLRRQFLCSGGIRRYGAVDAQVKRIAGRPGLDWLIPMWRTQSETAHMGGSDWLFEEVAEGRNDIIMPSPAHRVTWFQHATALYHNVAVTVLRILRRGADLTSESEIQYGNNVTILLQDERLRELIAS